MKFNKKHLSILITFGVLLILLVVGLVITREDKFTTDYAYDLFHNNKPQIIEDGELLYTNDNAFMTVGDDNVNGYWLYHDKWTTNSSTSERLTEDEMLTAVGLSKERYTNYLENLDTLGAFRIKASPRSRTNYNTSR